MHKYADCSFCGGQVNNEKVELDYLYKTKLYTFRNVTAGVCQQCGEKSVRSVVTEEIERKINSKHSWENAISVPVDVLPD